MPIDGSTSVFEITSDFVDKLEKMKGKEYGYLKRKSEIGTDQSDLVRSGRNSYAKLSFLQSCTKSYYKILERSCRCIRYYHMIIRNLM